MEIGDRQKAPRRRRRALAALAACGAFVVALSAAPAGAQIEPPVPLPTGLTDTVDDVIDTVVDAVVEAGEEVPEQLGGILGGPDASPQPKAKHPAAPRTGSWSTDRPPSSAPTAEPVLRVSDVRFRREISYGAALSDGLSRAAGRAANLAGPIAAPVLVALFAVALLLMAARGPGRLGKVEEERDAFGDRRHFRL